MLQSQLQGSVTLKLFHSAMYMNFTFSLHHPVSWIYVDLQLIAKPQTKIDPMHKWLQFNILLYAFKLAQLTSFERKNSFELSTQKQV